MKFKYVKEFEFPADRGFRGSNKMPSKVGKASGAPRMESKPKVGKGQGFADGGSAESSLARFKAKAAALRSKPKVSKAINMELPGKGTAVDAALARGREASYRGQAALNKLADLRQRMGVKPRPTPVKGKTKAQMAAEVSKAPQIADESGQYDPNRGSSGIIMAPAPVSMSAPSSPAVVSRGRYGMRPTMEYAKGGKAKVGKVMREYKEGKLHSGSKKGPVVKNEKQAVAIALSEARKAGAKIPKKAEGGIFNDEGMAYESKGPKTRGTARKGRMEGRRERRAREAMERAEKYAPGLSLDMPDKKKHGGMPVHRRKPMYGGGKC